MKALRGLLERFNLKNTKIRGQMYIIYILALLLPLSILGITLTYTARNLLNNHYMELLESDNWRVKSLLTEITTQTYKLSEEICFDSEQKNLLQREYINSQDFMNTVNESNKLDSIVYAYSEIENIHIYTNNPTIKNYKQYRSVTEDVMETDWYQKAIQTTGAFWVSIGLEGDYSNSDSNLCLVRRINLPDGKYSAVAVIRISDKYIRSRVDSNIIDAVSVDEYGIVYSSKKSWYGKEQFVDIDYADGYFSYSGTVEEEGTKYFATVSTAHLYMTSSKMHVCTLNSSGFREIDNILNVCFLIVILAIMVPGIILIVFTNHFTGRVYLLREEMHKARTQDYNMRDTFSGHDELTDAFEDLKSMVLGIQEKDAKMYEAELNEKELRNNQQLMEYKMLAGQMNPHYLYNTLETIRMKSLAAGNKEVADSIKILGKTLHYVLENTGTKVTTLQKELEHVENYLAIQKLRFGNRINYVIRIDKDINPEDVETLPLLLQPVVENAVVHGLESVDKEGRIVIDIVSMAEDKMQISVRDNGMGMKSEELEEIREKLNTPGLVLQSSIGVYNICQRIRLFYGEKYGLEIESVYGEGTTVILNLP